MNRGQRVNMAKKSKRHTGGFILKKPRNATEKKPGTTLFNVMLGFVLSSIPQPRGNRGYFGA